VARRTGGRASDSSCGHQILPPEEGRSWCGTVCGGLRTCGGGWTRSSTTCSRPNGRADGRRRGRRRFSSPRSRDEIEVGHACVQQCWAGGRTRCSTHNAVTVIDSRRRALSAHLGGVWHDRAHAYGECPGWPAAPGDGVRSGCGGAPVGQHLADRPRLGAASRVDRLSRRATKSGSWLREYGLRRGFDYHDSGRRPATRRRALRAKCTFEKHVGGRGAISKPHRSAN